MSLPKSAERVTIKSLFLYFKDVISGLMTTDSGSSSTYSESVRDVYTFAYSLLLSKKTVLILLSKTTKL